MIPLRVLFIRLLALATERTERYNPARVARQIARQSSKNRRRVAFRRDFPILEDGADYCGTPDSDPGQEACRGEIM